MKDVNSDIAYDYIRKRILSGECPPGHPLMTKVLSSAIGVSRTPVRDALRQLEADGLVTIRSRLGASVKVMDAKEYRDMCELRLALESHAAGLAARRRTEEDLQEMSYALEQMRRLTEQLAVMPEEDAPRLAELVQADVRFHIAIISAARNEVMKSEILRLHLIQRLISGPRGTPGQPAADKARLNEHRLNVLDSHDRIFGAIERQEIAAAKAGMEEHIQDIIDRTLQTLARSPGGPATRELTEEELHYLV